MSESKNILTPVGRLVSGHPMERNAVTDDNQKPKLQADGVTPRTQIYIALAIPKIAGQDWKNTEWGMSIVQAGQDGWAGGEWQAPTFAWKITDGDSAIPNKNNKKPCDQEGFAGNWIIKATTELSVRCHHAGAYEAHEVIQDPKAIKRGDFGRLFLSVKGNSPSKSAGVYINPELFSLDRAGEEIIVERGTDAVTAFGGGAPAVPAGAQVNPAIPAPTGSAPPPPASAPPPPAQPIAPAPDFLQPKPLRLFGAGSYTEEALLASGWTQANIDALPLG
jgi:hypothetical protein